MPNKPVIAVVQGIQSPLPPLQTGTHSYFNTLTAMPECFLNWSLRDQAQLNNLVADPTATFFSYNPASDTYSDPQDAAKLYIPAGKASSSIPTTQQLRMNIPTVLSGSLLFTWDWFWGPEFKDNRGAMNHYKAFHYFIGGHAMWTLMQSPAWSTTGNIGAVWDSLRHPGGAPNGLVQREPWTPAGLNCPDQRNGSGQQIRITPNSWMRYWVEIKLFQPHTTFTEWNQASGATLQPNPVDAQGRWHMVSQWYADEQRGPMRLLYRIPMNWLSTWSPHISRFDFEMNSSQSTGFIGPWIGYGRNVVVLRDYPANESDNILFQRPTG